MVQMMNLLKLLADIENHKCETVDLVIIPRRDAKYRDEHIPKEIEQKFKTEWIPGRRWASGWPMGPNALAMDCFREAHERWRRGEWNYAGYMLLESDCVPLQANWHQALYREWVGQQNCFLGHWIGHGTTPGQSHMNGNLIFHPAFFDKHPEMAYGEVTMRPWDDIWWPLIQTSATPSKLIFSDYRLNTRRNPWRGCDYIWETKFNREPTNPLKDVPLQPVWLHGCKGDEAIACVRKKLLGK